MLNVVSQILLLLLKRLLHNAVPFDAKLWRLCPLKIVLSLSHIHMKPSSDCGW